MSRGLQDQAGLYVPKPYPDELLYSVIGRFSLHLGQTSPKHVLDMLFGTRSVIASPDLQGQLGRLDWLLENRWKLSIQGSAMQYTLLPFYVSNRPPSERKKFAKALVRETGASVHTALGLCATSIRMPKYLRFCRTCANEEIKAQGEPYWHRSHQLPGVIVCPEHGEPLHISDIPIRPRGRHEFIPLTHKKVKGQSRQESIPENKHNVIWQIATRSRDFLDMTLNETTEDLWKVFRRSLAQLGYDGHHGSLEQLEKDFIAYFGCELLSRLDAGFEKHQTLGWLRAIRRKPRRNLHPLRQILLELFIQNKTVDKKTAPFGEGPWPCLNPLAKHYKETVVTDMRVFKDKRHTDRVLGRFTCSCGFVYSQRADQYPSEKPYRVIEHGPLFKLEAIDLQDRGYKVNAIANLLDIDWQTANRFIEAKTHKVSNNGYKQDKAEWIKLIANNPGMGVKSLRSQNPALYTRLYRHEREWLRNNSPRELNKTYKTSRYVDWAKRDREVSSQVIETAKEIKKAYPPKRVTRTRIATDLECRPLLEKKINKLPETNRCLLKVEESLLEFRIRRLHVAYAHAGSSISKSALLHAARVRKEYICEQVDAEINKLLQKPFEHCMHENEL